MKVPVEIFQSVSVLDGSDLVNKAYEGIVALMDMTKAHSNGLIAIMRFAGEATNARAGKAGKLRPSAAEFITGLKHGVYMPGVERDYWCGNFDVGVDDFPQAGCVYCQDDTDDGNFSYVHVKALGGFCRVCHLRVSTSGRLLPGVEGPVQPKRLHG